MGQIIEVLERYEIPDIPNIALPEEDGEPLESNWHRLQINLLDDIVRQQWRDRQDFFAGGNMFVYYSLQQARNRDYKGPDFFVVKSVDGSYPRNKWVAWEENGRLPDLIIELMSPSTMDEDLGSKRRLYEQTFRTPEYFCYDPDAQQLLGWRLNETKYVRIKPDQQGRLWSQKLDAFIGIWEGAYHNEPGAWLRLFDKAGHLIPNASETEHNRAEVERQRAETAEAELTRLREELARLKGK